MAAGRASKTRQPMLPRTPTLTCRALVGLLADYLAGDLATAERIALEGHLVACPECLAYVRTYRATVLAAREVCRDDDLTPDVPDALVQAIVAARRTPGRTQRRRGRKRRMMS
jgi:anti-sigma factor RsiW